ncbi:MAG: anthranilate synthase component I family protein [Clostridiales bacterium]|nr:anthranilate synthase component I family protein [Clostridiales bacterium]
MIIKPLKQEIGEFLEKYKTVPLSAKLDMRISPISTLKKLKAAGTHCYMLESCEDIEKSGRFTFLGYDPKLEITCNNFEVKITDEYGVKRVHSNPKPFLKEILENHKSPVFDYLPPFTGGLVGYFGYDYVKYSEPRLNLNARDDMHFKDMDLMLFDKVIAFDNKEKQIILICNMQTSDIEKNYLSAVKEINIMKEIIEHGADANIEKPVLKSDFKPLFSAEKYSKMVERAKRYIREGDIFQAVLSNRLEAEISGSLFYTYEELRKLNPSPYMFYFSSDDVEIAGASPETLVKLHNGILYTYPLAGTRPRGKTPKEDEKLQKELLSDEKELAEHNMLVDLGRNDLGKISKFASIKVNEFHNVLKFSHVMHIGSTVKSEIRSDKDALDAVDAVLPAGTLSGAPKIRAMEIINELENNKRGIYGGAIGYLAFTGNADTCIAIRIAYKKGGKVFVRSGAGIVADSNAQKENQECINKAMAVVKALEISGGNKNDTSY